MPISDAHYYYYNSQFIAFDFARLTRAYMVLFSFAAPLEH